MVSVRKVSRSLRSRRPGKTHLWNNANFIKLWAAESVTQMGSQVTLVALPLAAALVLDASAGQMGILTAAGTLPFLIFGLFAGVWVDRLRRRPIMIVSDVGRALVLLTVPIAWAFDALRIELLYGVAFTAGLLQVFFDVAYVSFLPVVVDRDDLVDGNSKLEVSASTAQVAGPGLGGMLVGLITAPFAILLDAISFLVSAVFLARMQVDEPAPERHGSAGVFREIGQGVGVVVKNPVLRAILGAGGTVNLFGWMFLAVYILYMIEELGFSSTQVGLVLSTGGVGAVVGASLAAPMKRRLGVGPTIIIGRSLFGVFGLLVPLAVLVPGAEVPLVVLAEFLQWLTLILATVNEISLRQSIIPPRLLGRATATFRFVFSGIIPFGALVGGFLGDWIGLRETLVLSCFGMLFAGVWVYFSPLRTMLTIPEPPEDLNPDLPRRTEQTPVVV